MCAYYFIIRLIIELKCKYEMSLGLSTIIIIVVIRDQMTTIGLSWNLLVMQMIHTFKVDLIRSTSWDIIIAVIVITVN